MFAYCGNNPVVNKDVCGTRFQAAFVVVQIDSPGIPYIKRLGTGPHSQLAQEIDALIGATISIRRVRDVFDVYNSIMEYESVQDISAVDQIYSGYATIKEGVAIFSLPIVTWIDEFIGGGKMIWGLAEILQGVVELLDGGTDR